MKLATFQTALRHGYVGLLLCLVLSCKPGRSGETEEGSYYQRLVDTILNDSNHDFKLIEKKRTSFYYEPDAFFNKNIGALTDDALAARTKCVRLLGNKEPEYKIKVIYFNDRRKIRSYLNMTPKGIALPDAYTLLIATNDSTRAYHTHEMMHIISINQFGGYAAQPSDWIQEGVAVYADSPCIQYSIHAIGAYLLHTGNLPTLDSLFYRFRSLDDMTAYMMAGSVSQFMIETYGLDKFVQVWKQGVEKLPSIIGKTKDDFEVEYHTYLQQQYPHPPDLDWDLLKRIGCG